MPKLTGWSRCAMCGRNLKGKRLLAAHVRACIERRKAVDAWKRGGQPAHNLKEPQCAFNTPNT